MTFLDGVKVALAVAAAIAGLALIRGPSKWKRLLGYNLVSAKITMIIIILAVSSGNTFYLDIALIYVLLSYIGIIALADYIVERNKKDKVNRPPGRLRLATHTGPINRFESTTLEPHGDAENIAAIKTVSRDYPEGINHVE
ncbi:MAG: hypothetical protein LBB58_05495 [Cellulomonadaceae bacterium]|nr:hypothetical protein [Cellulomonadaceae bacterium]